MRRNQLTELHYITPMANVPSILRRGILSHTRVEGLAHESVAALEIQDRRRTVVIPGGRRLHDYANVYLCGRNPMMFKRKDRHIDLCVLQVDPRVLDVEGAVISDKNASSDYVRFAPAPRGLAIVDYEMTFAEYWTDDDPILYMQKKSAKCAELLVPDRIDSQFVLGAYVSCEEARASYQKLGLTLPCRINGHLFFL